MLSAFRLLTVMRGVENAAISGLRPVASGIANSNLPVRNALYLGVFGGLLAIVLSGVRSFRIALSPSAWFLAVGSVLSLFATLMLWQAESILIAALPSTKEGVVAAASTIELLLGMCLFGGVASVAALLVGWLFDIAGNDIVGNPTRQRNPVAAISFVVVVFLSAAIAFQIRSSWLRNLYLQF